MVLNKLDCHYIHFITSFINNLKLAVVSGKIPEEILNFGVTVILKNEFCPHIPHLFIERR